MNGRFLAKIDQPWSIIMLKFGPMSNRDLFPLRFVPIPETIRFYFENPCSAQEHESKMLEKQSNLDNSIDEAPTDKIDSNFCPRKS